MSIEKSFNYSKYLVMLTAIHHTPQDKELKTWDVGEWGTFDTKLEAQNFMSDYAAYFTFKLFMEI